MRAWIILGAFALLAGCSRAPDGSTGPDLSGNATAGVAFTYGYAFELRSRSVADLQEAHAQACERAGAATCRITGLSYTVDREGAARASLSVRLAAPVARRFGRNAVVAGERFGATLVGAEITGEDVQPAAAQAAAAQRTAQGDAAAIDRDLANPRLSAAERIRLRDRRVAAVVAAREGAATAAAQADRLAATPMTFTYQAGHGVGFANALRDSADTALSSTRMTLVAGTWLLAALGPPALVLLLLWLVWRRWGRRLWLRVVGDPVA